MAIISLAGAIKRKDTIFYEENARVYMPLIIK